VHTNVCESNGISITDGIPGNGYNGISLNGAQYCAVTGNTCSDVLYGVTSVPLNLDAALNTTVSPQRAIVHNARTQNYGIVEYPADIREETPTAAPRTNALVTVNSVAHTVTSGAMVHNYAGSPNQYNGYFVATYIDADHWSFVIPGSPFPITGFSTSGSNKVLVSSGGHGLGVGEIWSILILDGNGAGDWYGTVTSATEITLNNMPDTYDVADSTQANAIQYGGNDHPDTMFLYSPEAVPSDHNSITGNVIVGNVSNPIPPAGAGYHAFVKGAMTCGANSTINGNLGQ
jgi:hypothetical protein